MPVLVETSPSYLKRRKFSSTSSSSSMEALAAKQNLGRDFRVFESSSSLPIQVLNDEETDDFYELNAEDYYEIWAARKEDKCLKTRKIREAEALARRSRITKAVIRVRFPDNHTFEKVFHPSEKIQALFDALMKVVARPDLPFHLFTTPPKKRISNLSEDFYSAGFVPGAILYFSYDAAIADAGPWEEIVSLKSSDAINAAAPVEPVKTAPEPEPVRIAPFLVPQKPNAAEKKVIKPKWLKL